MKKNDPAYQAYVDILSRELVPAMGCTEPIAIAYCAAKARSVLGALPERILVEASGNMIKNVKSVVVPNTNGQKGVKAAAAIGAFGGDEAAVLEVIAHISNGVKEKLPEYIDALDFKLLPLETTEALDFIITVFVKNSYARVRIAQEHSNIVLIEKDGEILFEKALSSVVSTDIPDYTFLNMARIFDFATSCDLEDVKDILARQIAMNSAISDEGLRGNYGVNIGKTLLATYGTDIKTRARARAAAGSDARMNGCELPVVINSGSGNQGITASLPVIEYAAALGVDDEKLYRALLISNLTTIHEKCSIGRLSAYCGAVSAGAGAGAGITYLMGGDLNAISHTVVNALAITSGIVCDGAKSSCAAKIAVAVDAGILGYEMYRSGNQFYDGEGLVVKGVDNSIRRFGRLGRVGMHETDKEIMRMMTEE